MRLVQVRFTLMNNATVSFICYSSSDSRASATMRLLPFSAAAEQSVNSAGTGNH
jgi:hypothetical protein